MRMRNFLLKMPIFAALWCAFMISSMPVSSHQISALGWIEMASAEEVSCECPKVDCGPCHEEESLSFYSEKCGPSLSRVKSCAKPHCVPLASPPSTCQNPEKSKGHVSAVNRETPDAGQTSANSPKLAERGREVGQVKSLAGAARVRLPDGKLVPVSEGMSIFERDTVQTDKDGKVEIEFKDGNLIQVQSDAAMKIDQYEVASEKRKALIDLLKGQIRNQVKQKYNGQTTTYQIRTKTAVAGVRGTDFTAEYRMGEKVETEIRTLEGKVVLANKDYTDSVDVPAGHGASFIVAANEVFSQDEINDFVARGYMTPVFKMSNADLAKLDERTRVARAGRGVASVKKVFVCHEPPAELNSCLWRCENNPKGEKSCRTDLSEVSCVRKRCNANGEWADEMRLPASLKEQCEAQSDKVAPCDY